ncbi:unnamed protein product [Ixodes persulcatus]
MESAGAVNIFLRSVEKHKMMYTTYVGDGDSKAYISVRDSQPFGKVREKHECVGHVRKRKGTRLRNIKKNEKREKLADGLPLSGEGRLTEKDRYSIQVYCGETIRGNTDSFGEYEMSFIGDIFSAAINRYQAQSQTLPKGAIFMVCV